VALQKRLWAATGVALRGDSPPLLARGVMDSLNESIDLASARTAARAAHIPDYVQWLLLVYAILAMAMLGTAPGGGSDVLRIFAPLRPGSRLGAARIDRISVVVDGRIMVDISVGDRHGSLGVMLHSPAAAQLVRAGPYVIYVHGTVTPELSAATPLLADALRQSGDAGAEVPEGLMPFARDPAPR
jgi:hypothetical protein